MNKALKLIISILVCQGAGIIGSVFTASSIPAWYATLQKPSFSPPNWVFGPVWAALFLLMGVSLFLVWKQHSNILENIGMLRTWKMGMVLFGIQLAFNVLWSIIFFGLRNPGAAFVEIIFLWLAILAVIIAFAKISPPAGGLAAWLLVPYILWVSFAGYLNYSIWTLNQETPVACTMDAKLCPDGSYVGRVPPNCEFAPCPGEMEWQAIKQAIVNCEVEKVWQAHDRRVEAKLKNGEALAAVEPEIDDIINIAEAAESKCGRIPIGTE